MCMVCITRYARAKDEFPFHFNGQYGNLNLKLAQGEAECNGYGLISVLVT